MKIVVAIKQVPDRDAQVRIAANGKWIDERDLQWAMNEPDAYALEEALQLKEKAGGEVIVLSAGPERVGSTIREALAKGADRAIHVVCDDLSARDALGVARLLAAAIKPENPDLVLTGLQSEDVGLGPDRRHRRRTARPAARHTDSARGEDRRRPQSEARAGRGMVPVDRVAHARGADHAVGREQAALRHADGHQARQDKRDCEQ